MQSSSDDTTYYEGGEFPFRDAKFSGAICIETLEHVCEPKQLLAEISRVLDDGGLFSFLFPGRQGGTMFHSTSSAIRLKD
jgi:ubiquinone/menaquinone biosynthesis C-methylase UbiE